MVMDTVCCLKSQMTFPYEECLSFQRFIVAIIVVKLYQHILVLYK